MWLECICKLGVLMILDSDEIDRLRAGSFVLDLLDIQLQARGDETDRYIGPGQIRQSASQLDFTLYDLKRKADPHRCMTERGSWVSPESLYDLHATDWAHRSWKAEYVLTQTSGHVRKPGLICSGFFHECTCVQESPYEANHGLWLFFPKHDSLPANLWSRISTSTEGSDEEQLSNHWIVRDDAYVLRFVQEKDGLEVHASSKRPLPAAFDRRIEEALWLIFGRPARWSLRYSREHKSQSFTIRQTSLEEFTPRLRPPIELCDLGSVDHVAELLRKYLRYSITSSQALYHPTGLNVMQVLRASSTSIEAEVLALSVAIESIIKREFFWLGLQDRQTIEALDDAVKYLIGWDGPVEVKKRIMSSIGNLKGQHSSAAFKRLVDAGILTPTVVKAWKKLRNTTAHGGMLDMPTHSVFDLCNKLHTSMMRLIFQAVGYSGLYTDRGEAGWPARMFEPRTLN